MCGRRGSGHSPESHEGSFCVAIASDLGGFLKPVQYFVRVRTVLSTSGLTLASPTPGTSVTAALLVAGPSLPGLCMVAWCDSCVAGTAEALGSSQAPVAVALDSQSFVPVLRSHAMWGVRAVVLCVFTSACSGLVRLPQQDVRQRLINDRRGLFAVQVRGAQVKLSGGQRACP